MSLENKISFDKIDILIKECKECKVEVPFYYIGSMGEEIGKKIELYNCPKCNGTYSKQTILEYNKK